MRTAGVFVLLILLFAYPLHAQAIDPSYAPGTPFYNQLQHDKVLASISERVAEKLLVQKVEPIWKHLPMEARVTGTVVVAFELGKSGEVWHPMVISGPRFLQKPVLDAVRKYKYNPYRINGEPVVVATKVSVTTTNF
jgi:hypothetical protein